MEKNNFVKQNYHIFVNSFKRINLKIFLILLFDILFYFVFMQVGNFFIKALEQKASNVDLTQNLLGLSQQSATQLLSSVRGVFFFLILSAIIFIILMTINWSFFKGWIWSITTNKKFNLKFFKKFFLLNIIWLPTWFILIFLFAIIIKPQTAAIFMLITLIIAFYFTNILYPLFLKNNKISVIKEAFKLGIKKIHHFVVPYLIIIILLLTISRIYSLITLNIYINPNIFFGVLLIFVAWLRYYFVEIVDSLRQ